MPRNGLYLYIGGAALLSVVCIVLGITASISRLYPSKNPGKYEFVFDSTIAGLAKLRFDYMFFAVVMFIAISVLMVVEVYSSIVMENSQAKDLPIAQRINQQLNHMP